jgi:hypothetical protein
VEMEYSGLKGTIFTPSFLRTFTTFKKKRYTMYQSKAHMYPVRQKIISALKPSTLTGLAEHAIMHLTIMLFHQNMKL